MKKRKVTFLPPPLKNKKTKTRIIIPGKLPTKKQKRECWKNVAHLKEQMTCPGCFKRQISRIESRGWHASHIRSRALGGEAEDYCLYPLCEHCNGDMRDDNMFLYFYKEKTLSRALLALIETMHELFKIQYPTQYKQHKGQFTRLARFYYQEQHPGDGGIPPNHPIFKQFLEYDIRLNSKETLRLKREYEAQYELSQEINREYNLLYFFSKIINYISCIN